MSVYCLHQALPSLLIELSKIVDKSAITSQQLLDGWDWCRNKRSSVYSKRHSGSLRIIVSLPGNSSEKDVMCTSETQMKDAVAKLSPRFLAAISFWSRKRRDMAKWGHKLCEEEQQQRSMPRRKNLKTNNWQFGKSEVITTSVPLKTTKKKN